MNTTVCSQERDGAGQGGLRSPWHMCLCQHSGFLETVSENIAQKEAAASLTVPVFLPASPRRSPSSNPMQSERREPWICADKGM